MQVENTKSLAIILTPNSMSYCTLKDTEKEIDFQNVHLFRVDENYPNLIEKEIENELTTNLVFRQDYHRIHLAFLTENMQVVPNEFLDIPFEKIMTLNQDSDQEKIFLDSPLSVTNASIVYEIKAYIKNLLFSLEHLKNVQLFHGGNIFLDHIETSQEDEVHLNLNSNSLEIAVFKQGELQFYNIFTTQSTEDTLYYILVVINQLDLDFNTCKVFCYGKLTFTSEEFQQIKKHVRHVNLGLKDEKLCENFTLYHLY